MKITEKFILGKRENQQLCEDILVVNENFIAVVDGMSDFSGFQIDGVSTGRKGALLVEEVIQNMPFDITAQEAVKLFTTAIHNFYVKQNILEKVTKDPNCRTGSSLVMYSKERGEIWSVGDCPFMVDGKVFDMSKRIDNLLYELRSFYIRTLLLQGVTIEELISHDTSAEFIKPIIALGRFHQNAKEFTEFNHAIVDGFEICEKEIIITKVGEGSEIVLASDGYPFLYNTLKESEEKLADTLANDPLCFVKFHSGKGVLEGNHSFDDRTYIKFIV